jgi:hypothetical protein
MTRYLLDETLYSGHCSKGRIRSGAADFRVAVVISRGSRCNMTFPHIMDDYHGSGNAGSATNSAQKKPLPSDLRFSRGSSCRAFPSAGNSDDPMGGQSIELRLFLSDNNVRGRGNGECEKSSDSGEGRRRYKPGYFNDQCSPICGLVALNHVSMT